jgi:hypothetical protein
MTGRSPPEEIPRLAGCQSHGRRGGWRMLANPIVIDAYRAGIPDSALHSMIANKGGSHEGADGYHIPRPIG